MQSSPTRMSSGACERAAAAPGRTTRQSPPRRSTGRSPPGPPVHRRARAVQCGRAARAPRDALRPGGDPEGSCATWRPCGSSARCVRSTRPPAHRHHLRGHRDDSRRRSSSHSTARDSPNGPFAIAASLADRLGADVVLVADALYGDRAGDALHYLEGRCDVREPVLTSMTIVVAPIVEPADAIFDVVRRAPRAHRLHDDARPRSVALGRAGSVTEDVIQRSTQPVLLIGPRGEPTWSRPARQSRRLRRRRRASGHAATAARLRVGQGARARGRARVRQPPSRRRGRRAPGAAVRAAEELVRAAGSRWDAPAVRSSFVAGALVDFAEEPRRHAARHGGPPSQRASRAWRSGASTMGVLNTSTCPVLVVPPGRHGLERPGLRRRP